MTPLSAMKFMTIIIIIGFMSNCDGVRTGGWSDVKDISEVRDYVQEIKSNIVQQLNENKDCDVVVISAQQQVVAGMNYKAAIRVCDKDYADVQFFVGLPVDGVRPKPSNIKVKQIQRSEL
eukprot:85529_1